MMLTVVVSLVCVGVVHSYSTGAPQGSCYSMQPLHISSDSYTTAIICDNDSTDCNGLSIEVSHSGQSAGGRYICDAEYDGNFL